MPTSSSIVWRFVFKEYHKPFFSALMRSCATAVFLWSCGPKSNIATDASSRWGLGRASVMTVWKLLTMLSHSRSVSCHCMLCWFCLLLLYRRPQQWWSNLWVTLSLWSADLLTWRQRFVQPQRIPLPIISYSLDAFGVSFSKLTGPPAVKSWRRAYRPIA